MDTTPQLTIAICTRNRADVLTDVCAALQHQTVPAERFALTVVNNGSTDATPELLRTLSAHFPHFLEIYEGVPGSSLARNRAVEQCTTPWVAFLDDDALPDADYVENALVRIAHTPHACLAGETRAWRRGPLPDWFLDEYEDFIMHDKTQTALKPGEYGFGGNLLVQTAALRHIGGFDSRLGGAGSQFCFGEETDLQIRLRQAGYSLGYAPDVRVAHFAKPERYTLHNVLRVCHLKTLVLLVLQNRGSWQDGVRSLLKIVWCPLRNLLTGLARLRHSQRHNPPQGQPQNRWTWKNVLIHTAEGFCQATGSLQGWLWLRQHGPWRAMPPENHP